MRAFLFFLLLFPLSLSAQVTITGKILDAGSKPIPFANVFLSNTQVGAQTRDDGSFTLNNVKPGLYDLLPVDYVVGH